MGNICRSPTAEGVFLKLVEDAGLADVIITESAGTIGYHAGEPPDQRAMEMAKRRGINLSSLIARKVSSSDYIKQTYILAMDYANLSNLGADCPDEFQPKLELLLSYHPDKSLKEVPDPYYGENRGFENVFEMIEIACTNLLQQIKLKYSL